MPPFLTMHQQHVQVASLNQAACPGSALSPHTFHLQLLQAVVYRLQVLFQAGASRLCFVLGALRAVRTPTPYECVFIGAYETRQFSLVRE
jgi:hypothetical protein